MRATSAEFAKTIRRSHRLATQLEVLRDGVPVETIEDVVDGTVTLDINAATRGRADIAVVDDGTRGWVPTGSGSLLAPYGNEVRVSRGVYLPDGTRELVGLGIYRIDDVQINDAPGGLEIRIAGLDRSVRIIDARFEEPYQIVAGTPYTEAIKATILIADPTATFDFVGTSLVTPQLITAEGEDRWKFCQDMAASLGCVLYVDGDGTYVLRPVAQAGATAPAGTLTEGADGLLLSAGRRWTRQGTFNRVIATGENTGQDAPVRGVATDNNPLSPTYYFGPFGRVPRFYVSQFIVTEAQAVDAAAGYLAREVGTTRQVNFGTVVNPALEPNDVVQITRARAGIDEQHVIDSLTIPLAASGVMSGQTRSVVST